MKPIGDEGLKDLQIGTKVGYSRKGTYSDGKEWHIVAMGSVESKPKGVPRSMVLVALEKVYVGKDPHQNVVAGDRYVVYADYLYPSTAVCSECKGEGEFVVGQEAKGYYETCEYCGGCGLEPIDKEQ